MRIGPACLVAAGLMLIHMRLAHAAGGACGVVTEPSDWTRGDAHGDLSARSEAECRARSFQVIRRFATEDEALAAVAGGTIEAASGITPSADRAHQYGVMFMPPFLLDQLRIVVRAASGIRSQEGLRGRTLCFIAGEAGEAAALQAAVPQAAAGPIIPSPFEEEGEMGAALAGGRCAAVADTESRLAALAAQFPGVRLVLLPGALGSVPASVAVSATPGGRR